jgi:hypothetical protein
MCCAGLLRVHCLFYALHHSAVWITHVWFSGGLASAVRLLHIHMYARVPKKGALGKGSPGQCSIPVVCGVLCRSCVHSTAVYLVRSPSAQIYMRMHHIVLAMALLQDAELGNSRLTPAWPLVGVGYCASCAGMGGFVLWCTYPGFGSVLVCKPLPGS